MFNNPEGLVVGYGYVIVADTGNNLIRNVTTSTGQVTTTAGQAGVTGSTDGPASTASFNLPTGVAVDSAGDVYVTDSGNNTIRYISGGSVTTLAGSAGVTGALNATGTSATFNNPTGICTNGYGINATLYIADSGNNMIRVITSGVVSTLAGQLSPGAVNAKGTSASFNNPTGVAMDSNGNLYVADSGNNLIREINISSGIVTTLAGSGSAGSTNGNGYIASFDQPFGIAVDTGGTTAFVADYALSLIREIQF